MGECSRVFLVVLVVESCLEQGGSPGIVADRNALIIHICLAIFVCIHEEVRVGSDIIHDRSALFFGVSLDSRVQAFSEGIDFSLDAFLDVAVAVEVGGGHPECGWILRIGCSTMAGCTGFDFDSQSMYVVTILALVQWVLGIVTDILLTIKLVGALNFCTEQGSSGGEVVDVGKGDRGIHALRILARQGFVDGRG